MVSASSTHISRTSLEPRSGTPAATTAGTATAPPSEISPYAPAGTPLPTGDNALSADGASSWPIYLSTLEQTAGAPCKTSDPQTCGCASLNQADYRGSTSTTASGTECVRRDEFRYLPEYYLEAGLEGNDYCPNPYTVNEFQAYRLLAETLRRLQAE